MLLIAPVLTFANPEEYENKRIIGIEFVPAKQPVASAELNDILPLKKDTPLQMSVVRASIERLYATGRYEDIQVDAELQGEGVVVRFLTKGSWFVGRVAVQGNLSDPPNRGQLVNATRLDLGEPFSEEKVEQARSGLTQILKSNGFYETRIEPQFDYDPDTQQVHIRFTVDPGKRARFERPEFKGDKKLSDEKIIKATKWRRWIIGTWKPVTQPRVRQGVDRVQRKYQDEDRLMASVELTSIDYNSDTERAKPTLTIDAGPKVEVRTIGAKLSQSKLKRYIPIYDEHTVDRDLLVEGVRNLRDYYQSQGYFEVDIAFKEQRAGTVDKAFIDYLINLGERHKLVKVEIQGNKYFTTDTIRERIFLLPSSFQFRRGRYSESFRRRDEETIANLYKSNGFRDVKVTSTAEDDYQGKQGEIAVTFNIDEGPQWFVNALEVTGIEQLDASGILPTLSSSEGQPYSDFSVAADRDRILAFYYSNGFSNAGFEWSATPGPDPKLVNLHFVISEGKRQFVRDILIEGLQTTRESMVDKNLLVEEGKPLSPIQLTDTQRRLYELGVFAKVDMAIQNPDGETQHKYVIYQMEEARRYSLTGGIGAEIARIGGGGSQTSLDSPAGKAGFSPRVSFDISRLNFLGLGHTVSFRSRVSNLQKRGIINYSAPRYRNVEGRNLSFTALYDDSRDVRTFTAKRLEGSVQLSQKLSKPTTALFRFSYRRVAVSNVVIPQLLVPQLLQPVRIGILSGTFIQDRRDDPTDSRKGIYNTLDVGLASRFFGSQRNFFRGLGRNATYHRVGKKMVLARECSFGLVSPFRLPTGIQSAIESIPLPERFFGGGGTSHRGFPENQAGPRDLGGKDANGAQIPPTGFPLGGTALLFNKTELRFPLLGDNISGVLFHDAGNVYSSLSKISFGFSQPNLKEIEAMNKAILDKDNSLLETNRALAQSKGFDYMVHAVGMGVRYRTPIGPVRVDLAYSVNSPQFLGFKGSFQELLQCGGPNACPVVQQRISRFQFFFSIGQTF